MGASRVGLSVRPSIGLWFRFSKWSDVLQVNITMFHSGPSIAHFIFYLENLKVKVSDAKMSKSFLSITPPEILRVKTKMSKFQ